MLFACGLSLLGKTNTQDTRDRREVEPRLNAPYSADHGGKTEITFEDFDLVDECSEEEGAGMDDDDDNDDDDDGW